MKTYRLVVYKLIILSVFILFYSGCKEVQREYKRAHHNRRGNLQLSTNATMGFIPFQVKITARLLANTISPLGSENSENIVILWVETKPDGHDYRSKEEFSLTKTELLKDSFFYYSPQMDEPGRYRFYLTIFPNDKKRKIVSNQVSILARENLSEMY